MSASSRRGANRRGRSEAHGAKYTPIFYKAPMDYLFAALIFAFIVTVLVVLWKREHPRKR